MFDINMISDMSFLRQSLLPRDLGKIRTEQKISWPFRRNIFYVTPVLRFNFFHFICAAQPLKHTTKL